MKSVGTSSLKYALQSWRLLAQNTEWLPCCWLPWHSMSIWGGRNLPQVPCICRCCSENACFFGWRWISPFQIVPQFFFWKWTFLHWVWPHWEGNARWGLFTRQAKETRSLLPWASIWQKEFSSGTLEQASKALTEGMVADLLIPVVGA